MLSSTLINEFTIIIIIIIIIINYDLFGEKYMKTFNKKNTTR